MRPREVWHRRTGERGLTLIEMVVTIAIMAIGIVGISAGVAQAHFIAGINQSQAQMEVVMRQLSDYVRDSSGTGLAYKACATTSDYSAARNPNYPTLPSGVSSWGVSKVVLSTSAVRNGVATTPITNGYCRTNGTCNSSNLCDWGVQEITVSLTSGSFTLTRTVWKSATW